MNQNLKEENLVNEFKNNQDILVAIGHETRQAILITLMLGSQHPGMRVGEITTKTNLSRPAVSHHLKILREAGIISVHKKGTMNYYHLDSKGNLKSLKHLVSLIEEMLIQCELRSQTEENGNDDGKACN